MDLGYDLGYDIETSVTKKNKLSSRGEAEGTSIRKIPSPEHAFRDPENVNVTYWMAPPTKVGSKPAGSPVDPVVEKAEKDAKIARLTKEIEDLKGKTAALQKTATEKPLVKPDGTEPDAAKGEKSNADIYRAHLATIAAKESQLAALKGEKPPAKSRGPGKPKVAEPTPPTTYPELKSHYVSGDELAKAKVATGANVKAEKIAPTTDVTYTAAQIKDQETLRTNLENVFVGELSARDKKDPAKVAEAKANAAAYFDCLKQKAESEKTPNPDWAKGLNEGDKSLFEKGKAKGSLILKDSKKPSELMTTAIADQKTKAGTALGTTGLLAAGTDAAGAAGAAEGDVKALYGDKLKPNEQLRALMEREKSYAALAKYKGSLKVPNNSKPPEMRAMTDVEFQKHVTDQGLYSDKKAGDRSVLKKDFSPADATAKLDRPKAIENLRKKMMMPTDKGGLGMDDKEADLALRYMRLHDSSGNKGNILNASPTAINSSWDSMKGKSKEDVLSGLRKNAVEDMRAEVRRIHPDWDDVRVNTFLADQDKLSQDRTLGEMDTFLTTLKDQKPMVAVDSAKLGEEMDGKAEAAASKVAPEFKSLVRTKQSDASVVGKDEIDKIVTTYGLKGKRADEFRKDAAGLALQEKYKLADHLRQEQLQDKRIEGERETQTAVEKLRAENALKQADHQQKLDMAKQNDQQAHDKEMKMQEFGMQLITKMMEGMMQMQQAYAQAFFQANMPKTYDQQAFAGVWQTVAGGRGGRQG